VNTFSVELCVIAVYNKTDDDFMGYHRKSRTWSPTKDILQATFYTRANANRAISYHQYMKTKDLKIVSGSATFKLDI